VGRKIDVIFNLIDNFSSSFDKTIKTMTAGTKKAQNAWKGVEKIGDNITGTGAKLSAAVTAPLVGLGAISASEFGSVDKSLRLVKETMGSTDEQAKALEGAIKKAAANSVFGMQDAADATLNFARQGWDATQAANMISPAFDLAAGTATDLSTVTGGLGNTLKAFGEDADKATKYTDMMAKAQAQANTDVMGLFDAMSIAGSTANTVGWGFSDLATLTGVFGDHSISASEGATALNTGLMRLASPAKEGAGALKELGINVFDADGKLKSMPDTMSELQKGFSGLSDKQQLAAASAIFGKNQAAKWITLINGPGGDALQGLKDNIEGATGASHDMANALLSGPGGAVEKLKSSFDVFKYTVGETVSGAITPFIEKATGLIDSFNNMDESQRKQIIKWAAMAAVVGPALVGFGKVVSTIGKVGVNINKFVGIASRAAGGFKELKTGAGLVKVGMAALTSPFAIVLGVIAALIVVVISVRKHFNVFKAMVNSTSPAMQKLRANLQRIRTALAPVGTVVKKVGSIFMNVFGGVIAGACGLAVATLIEIASKISSIVVGIIDKIKEIVAFIKGPFAEGWSAGWESAKEVFSGIIEKIKGIISKVTGTIEKLANGVKKIFGSGGSNTTASVNPVPGRAIGDRSWRGGLVQVHERGGEILDLPQGTRIYPHDVSMQMAKTGQSQSVSIAKLADQIVVREDADIDRIADALLRKIKSASGNMGGVSVAGMA